MEVLIRKIGEEEVSKLSALAKEIFSYTFCGTCTESDMEGYLEEYFNEQRLRDEINDKDNFYFFAEVGNAPVAYIMFAEDYRGFPLMEKWKALELKRIYVHREYLGKGIAQKLMDHCLGHAYRYGYQVVWLGVWEHNLRAQKFYEKYGFTHSGHTHNFPIGNTPQADSWMWKFL